MRTYNISARNLGDALELFGRQSNAQLLFSPRLVEGRHSKTLKGQYEPEAAGAGAQGRTGQDGPAAP
jgi:hypothetical protein